MAETRIDSPTFIPSNPTTLNNEQFSLLKRRKIEQENTQDFASSTASEKSKGDLFPQINRKLPLPDEGSEVNFDKPSFVAARENSESKPILPQPDFSVPKEEQGTIEWLLSFLPWGSNQEEQDIINPWDRENRPISEGEPLINFNNRVHPNTTSSGDNDPLSHLPNHGGSVLAKLIAMITDYQALSQSSQLEVFSATNEQLEEIRRKQFEIIKEQIKNRRDNENWSYRMEILTYLGIASGFVTGATLMGVTLSTGGTYLIPALQTLAGTALALGAKLGEKYTDQKGLLCLAGLAGAILSGYGAAQGMPVIGSFMDMMGQGKTVTLKIAEFLVRLKNNGVQAQRYEIGAKTARLQFEKEENELNMKKIIGGFKASKESSNLLGAASKVMRTEDEIKSRIALGETA